jgi:2-dehydro-3-deoxy-D-gluconate 5-dehydrogenase
MTTGAAFDVTGRVAAVSGGNTGIGKTIAVGLAQAGAAVAIMARAKSVENNTDKT